MSREERTLAAAELTAGALLAHGVPSVLIGALAMARHGYVRATVDVDLAVSAPLATLREVAARLRERGYDTHLEEPDADDPLGGVLTVTSADTDPVQVVNFHDRFPRLVDEAVSRGAPLGDGADLRVTDLGTLILFKLYAGGRKSEVDILELLDRHPQLDLSEVQARSRQLGLDRALGLLLSRRGG